MRRWTSGSPSRSCGRAGSARRCSCPWPPAGSRSGRCCWPAAPAGRCSTTVRCAWWRSSAIAAGWWRSPRSTRTPRAPSARTPPRWCSWSARRSPTCAATRTRRPAGSHCTTRTTTWCCWRSTTTGRASTPPPPRVPGGALGTCGPAPHGWGDGPRSSACRARARPSGWRYPSSAELKIRRGRGPEPVVQLVLLRVVQPQDGVQPIQGAPQIQHVLGGWAARREAVHQAAVAAGQVGDLQVGRAHRAERVLAAEEVGEPGGGQLVIPPLMGEEPPLQEGGEFLQIVDLRGGAVGLEAVGDTADAVQPRRQVAVLLAEPRGGLGERTWWLGAGPPAVTERTQSIEDHGHVDRLLDDRADERDQPAAGGDQHGDQRQAHAGEHALERDRA